MAIKDALLEAPSYTFKKSNGQLGEKGMGLIEGEGLNRGVVTAVESSIMR